MSRSRGVALGTLDSGGFPFKGRGGCLCDRDDRLRGQGRLSRAGCLTDTGGRKVERLERLILKAFCGMPWGAVGGLDEGDVGIN